MEALYELMKKEEPLREDLLPYVVEGPLGKMIHHKWIIQISYHEQFNALINRQYEEKKKRIEEAFQKVDWPCYLGFHERPYRVPAFLEISEKLNDKDYWEAVAYLWTDTENFHQEQDNWLEIWTAPRPGREGVMDEEERVALSKLPDNMTVYRGTSTLEGTDGFSWTRDKKKAIWFAKRFRPAEAYLCIGKVRRSDVLAYFLGRKESEIVVLPENVRSMRVEDL